MILDRAKNFLLKYLAAFPPELALQAFWLAAVFYFTVDHSPFFAYRYDWDPGDGDVLNTLLRLKAGLPIYGSWDRAEIMSLYPPMFHVLLIPFVAIGIDGVMLGRMLSVLFIPATSVAAIWAVRAMLARERNAKAWGWIAGILVMFTWRNYAFASHLRPDPMALFLVVFGAGLAMLKPERVRAVAAVAVMAFFTKQNGAALGLGCTFYYAFVHRKHLAGFLVYAFLFFAGPTLLLEALNHGHFLKSMFLEPAHYFAGPGRLNWEHFRGLWEAYYGQGIWRWMLPLAIVGAVGSWIRGYRGVAALVLVYTADLVYNFKAARHYGAGASYFYVNWCLTAVLAALGLWQMSLMIRALSPRMISPRFSAVAPILVALWMSYTVSIKALLNDRPIDLGPTKATSIAHDILIQKLVSEFPREEWVSERAPIAILHAGKFVDREMCSVNGAYAPLPDAAGTRYFLSQLRHGEYGFFQQGLSFGCGAVAGMYAVLDQCFDPLQESHVIFYGGTVPVKILRYNGAKKGCLPPAPKS